MPTRGYKMSEEAKAKIAAAHRGKPKSLEHCAAISAAKTGKTHRGVPMSDETRRKISATKTGVPLPQSPEWRAKIADKARERSGERHPLWAGADVSYAALHSWLRREYGAPTQCDHCGTTDGELEWANRTGDYRRDRDDWLELCVPCHRAYDRLDPKRQRH